MPTPNIPPESVSLSSVAGTTVYPTGLTLCGEFTEIQLASGRVLVYNKEGV